MINVMMNLLLNRQIKFENGKLELMGIRDSFTPIETYIEILKILNKANEENLIYYSAKIAGYNWLKSMKITFPGLKQKEAIQWGIDLVSASGWGIPSIEKIDFEANTAIFLLSKSITSQLYGKSEKPVDHLFRGMLAGGLSYILKQELDSVEIECSAMTNINNCRFIVGPISKLNLYGNQTEMQLKKIEGFVRERDT